MSFYKLYNQLKIPELLPLLFSVLLSCTYGTVSGENSELLQLESRQRIEFTPASNIYNVQYRQLRWLARETAIIVCDMWDKHWCKGATHRVAEMAPLMNQVISLARQRGVLIIHAPSGTMEYYKDYPARHRAENAPRAKDLPKGIAKWCNWLNNKEHRAWPIDQSDGGCDCNPPCKQMSLWQHEIDTIKIHNEDAISDSGVEIWNLMAQRGIKNVILMGVHTNMCVLGRPFGLRNMVRYGKNVVLMRDLTDTMYNSRRPPYVNHFTGTDFIIEHIEKYICPTITSTVFTGEPPFRFSGDHRPRLVFLSAESEYQSANTLPPFAHDLELNFGLHCEILQGTCDSSKLNAPGRNYIPGMETLANADAALIFVRRRALPPRSMQYFRDFLTRGKGLIGLRTASHAFDTKGNAPKNLLEWPTFDPDVLGGNYHNHYKNGPLTTVSVAVGAVNHPILQHVKLPFTTKGSLYKTSPLKKSTTLLLWGSTPGENPEPIAWTNMYGKCRIFYTALGHPDDFQNPDFLRLLLNAISWVLDKPMVPTTG